MTVHEADPSIRHLAIRLSLHDQLSSRATLFAAYCKFSQRFPLLDETRYTQMSSYFDTESKDLLRKGHSLRITSRTTAPRAVALVVKTILTRSDPVLLRRELSFLLPASSGRYYEHDILFIQHFVRSHGLLQIQGPLLYIGSCRQRRLHSVLLTRSGRAAHISFDVVTWARSPWASLSVSYQLSVDIDLHDEPHAEIGTLGEAAYIELLDLASELGLVAAIVWLDRDKYGMWSAT